MDTARIAALLDPFLDRSLAASQLHQISTYIDLLLRWNARINLTAIRNPDQIVTRHFGESFFLARHIFPIDRRTLPTIHVLDLGSGAGFPGLPVKIWAPNIRLTLIESNHKKAAFLREVTRALILTNVNVLAERAEIVAARLAHAPSLAPATAGSPVVPRGSADSHSVAGSPGSAVPPASSLVPPAADVPFRADIPIRADVVTFRAVEKFDRILPLATNFLAPNARLALLISSTQLPRLEVAPSTLKWKTIYVPESQKRVLAIGSRRSVP